MDPLPCKTLDGRLWPGSKETHHRFQRQEFHELYFGKSEMYLDV